MLSRRGIDGVVEEAVLVPPDLQDAVQHDVDRLVIGFLLRRQGVVHRGVELAQARHDLAAVIPQPEPLLVPRGMAAAEKIVVAQPHGPFQVLPIVRHPVDPGEGLEHLAVHLMVRRGDRPEIGLDRRVLPDRIEHLDHSIGPEALSEPLGERQEPVLDVLRRAEDQPVDVRLLVMETPFREGVGVRQGSHARAELPLGAQHLEHASLEEGAVDQGRGENHEGIVVRRAVTGIPEIAPLSQVPGDQPASTVRLRQPSFHVSAAPLQPLGGQDPVFPRSLEDLVPFVRPAGEAVPGSGRLREA